MIGMSRFREISFTGLKKSVPNRLYAPCLQKRIKEKKNAKENSKTESPFTSEGLSKL